MEVAKRFTTQGNRLMLERMYLKMLREDFAKRNHANPAVSITARRDVRQDISVLRMVRNFEINAA
jgi:hypothetical protein